MILWWIFALNLKIWIQPNKEQSKWSSFPTWVPFDRFRLNLSSFLLKVFIEFLPPYFHWWFCAMFLYYFLFCSWIPWYMYTWAFLCIDFVCDSGTIYVANSHFICILDECEYLFYYYVWWACIWRKNEVKIKKRNETQMGGIKTMVVYTHWIQIESK